MLNVRATRRTFDNLNSAVINFVQKNTIYCVSAIDK